MDNVLKYFIRLLCLLILTVPGCDNAGQKETSWREEKGMLVIEAEDGIFSDEASGWTEETEFPGYTGRGYVIWRGKSSWGPESKEYDSMPPHNVISYNIEITNPGTYYVKVLNYHLQEDGDNDVWTSVNKSEWGKTYDWQVRSWTLDERGEWAKVHLEKGRHLVQIAGRSPGFAVDQIVLYEQSVKNNPPIGTDTSLAK